MGDTSEIIDGEKVSSKSNQTVSKKNSAGWELGGILLGRCGCPFQFSPEYSLEHFLIRLLPLPLHQTAIPKIIHGSTKWYLPATSQSASCLTYQALGQLITLCWNTVCTWLPGHHCPGLLPPPWPPFSASFAGSFISSTSACWIRPGHSS